MAIELNNLIFVHCPKTGGKFITKCLLESVENCIQIGHPVWDGHIRYSLYNKMTFGYIRHPISFLESLWSHRKRKKVYDAKKFNWQDYVRLERICQSDNFHEFLINVSNHEDIVWDFYMYYLGGHRQIRLLKFENLLPSLMDILEEFNVKYDKKKVKYFSSFRRASVLEIYFTHNSWIIFFN